MRRNRQLLRGLIFRRAGHAAQQAGFRRKNDVPEHVV